MPPTRAAAVMAVVTAVAVVRITASTGPTVPSTTLKERMEKESLAVLTLEEEVKEEGKGIDGGLEGKGTEGQTDKDGDGGLDEEEKRKEGHLDKDGDGGLDEEEKRKEGHVNKDGDGGLDEEEKRREEHLDKDGDGGDLGGGHHEDSINPELRTRDSGDAWVKAVLVVGGEEGWRAGRVEEMQLRSSAQHFNFDIQMQSEDEVPRCVTDGGDDTLLIFLPRAEGVVQGGAGSVAAALVETGASILLPHPRHRLQALVGWTRSVREAARQATGVTSLAALAELLQGDDTLRRKFRARVDSSDRVFHVLNESSSVDQGHSGVLGVDGDVLHLNASGDRYQLWVNGHVPPLLLATPSSARARALLLALSDYLTGTQHPEHGCISCLDTEDNSEGVSEEELVVVGVFVERPQPFLHTSLHSLLHSGLHPPSVHFYICNQVKEYQEEVEKFAEDLRRAGVRNVALEKHFGDPRSMAHTKDKLVEECKRLGCGWLLHVSSTAFLNPGVPARLIGHHSDHPVLSPGLRVQRGIEATFWRDINPQDSTPTHSWDHATIMSGQPSARGHWHASCLKGVYAIRGDVLADLRAPYTRLLHVHPDSDLAFCATLREAGVPMVVTTAMPNLGVLANTTNHTTATPDLATYPTNPVMWGVVYLRPTWTKIMAGDLSLVSRPCPEVYQFPTFTDRFSQDLLRLAYIRDKWSPALRQDPRKKGPGVEAVPTVDQWLSDLGLELMIDELHEDVFKRQLLISFPHASPDPVVASMLARFRPGETSGLASHHDASAVTFHVRLTPPQLYQGGELEFPRQQCRVQPDVGEVLVFPGRLTHPKVLHNVTHGHLHTLIIHIDFYHVKIRRFF